MGIPALYMGNLARLASVFIVSRRHPSLFGIVHAYLGQIFTILIVVLACIVRLRWVNRGPAAGLVAKAAGFAARLLLLSGCMFLFWMEVHHWYVRLLDRFMILGFSFFGYRLFVPQETAAYYETFSIPAFAPLVLATGSIGWSRKAKGLALETRLFFLLHLFHRIDNALISAFHFASLFQLDVFLCDIGQYLLPMLLWLAAAILRLPGGKPAEPS